MEKELIKKIGELKTENNTFQELMGLISNEFYDGDPNENYTVLDIAQNYWEQWSEEGESDMFEVIYLKLDETNHLFTDWELTTDMIEIFEEPEEVQSWLIKNGKKVNDDKADGFEIWKNEEYPDLTMIIHPENDECGEDILLYYEDQNTPYYHKNQ